jgi:hypothetical protein
VNRIVREARAHATQPLGTLYHRCSSAASTRHGGVTELRARTLAEPPRLRRHKLDDAFALGG